MAAGDLTATRGNYSDYECNVFDGVDDYIEIPHNAAQLGTNLSNGFTISAWINPRSAGEGPNAGSIIDKSEGTSVQNGFTFRMNDGLVRFRIAAVADTSSAASSITYGNWYHVLVTINTEPKAQIYINGVASGSLTTTGLLSAITTTNAMRIGNRAGATDRTFNGSIRSVKMWNRVLSTTEIAQDYAGTIVSTGLIHHFKLGGDYADYGSVGVTATNSGSIYNKSGMNQINTDISQMNIAATTSMDNLIVIPNPMGKEVIAIGINRAA